MPPWVLGQETKPAPMTLLLGSPSSTPGTATTAPTCCWIPPPPATPTAAGLCTPAARQNQPSCTSPAACGRASGPCWWPTAAGPRPRPPTCTPFRPPPAPPGRAAGRPDSQVSVTAGPGGPLDAGLATLLLAIRDAQRDGTWQRLKAWAIPTASGPSTTAPTAGQAPGATWPPAATGSKTAGSGNASTDQARRPGPPTIHGTGPHPTEPSIQRVAARDGRCRRADHGNAVFRFTLRNRSWRGAQRTLPPICVTTGVWCQIAWAGADQDVLLGR